MCVFDVYAFCSPSFDLNTYSLHNAYITDDNYDNIE